MTYNEWEKLVPAVIRQDVLWTVTAYRLALFVSDIAWKDVQRLAKETCTRSLSDQLYRSVGSICANIRKVIRRSVLKTVRGFMNILWGRRVRVAGGSIVVGMCWEQKSQNIA